MITLILIAFSPLEERLILHEFGLINLQLFMNLQNASPCRVKTMKPGLPLLPLPKLLLPIRQICRKVLSFTHPVLSCTDDILFLAVLHPKHSSR